MRSPRRPATVPQDRPGAQAGVAPFPALESGRQPLYLSLAHALKHDIDQGRYPVGGLLPTEEEIATRYALSRHTVRQALRELKEDGVISAHPGIGTRVRARTESARFFSGISTVADLLQFVESTEMQVLGRQEVVADEAFAAQFHCKPGQAWLEVKLLRKLPEHKRPLGYVQAYVRAEYAQALGRDKSYNRPIYSVIEERCGVRIVEILQEITAANLDAAMARVLKAKEGQAAMRITRFFLDRAGTVVEISVGHYPSGLYTQRSRFRAHRAEREEPPTEAVAPPARAVAKARKA